MKKLPLSKAERKEAQLVAKEIRDAFDAVRRNTLAAIHDNIDEAVRVLIENIGDIGESNSKAVRVAKRGFKELRAQLVYDTKLSCNDLRDYHAENAIEDQFKLMTIAGRVIIRKHGKKK